MKELRYLKELGNRRLDAVRTCKSILPCRGLGFGVRCLVLTYVNDSFTSILFQVPYTTNIPQASTNLEP